MMNEQPVLFLKANPSARLLSIDVFRGITIAAMILVTDPGTYDAVYPQLRHAEWMGATATDMIFPSFLFIVGMSISLSFNAARNNGISIHHLSKHLVYRSIILFLLGLAVNGFPDYNWHLLRFPGILQRIAICYFCCGMLYLYLLNINSRNMDGNALKKQPYLVLCIAFLLLFIYSGLLLWMPVPGLGKGHLDSFANLPAYIDRSLLGTNHMWVWGLTAGKGVTYDPEGILSTLPAISSTLIGLATGVWWLKAGSSENKKLQILVLSGVFLIIAGLLFNFIIPINKRIWTGSFALLSSGVALILFVVLYIIVDGRRFWNWTYPFRVFGTNAILAFIISGIITTLFDLFHFTAFGNKRLSIHQIGYQLMTSTGLSAINASLLYGTTIVTINMLILLPLYRKRIFIKI